jgi:hypothetical protein
VIKEKLNPRIDQFIHFVTLNSFSEIPTYLKKKIEVRVELTENVQIKSSYEGRELVSTNLNKDYTYISIRIVSLYVDSNNYYSLLANLVDR